MVKPPKIDQSSTPHLVMLTSDGDFFDPRMKFTASEMITVVKASRCFLQFPQGVYSASSNAASSARSSAEPITSATTSTTAFSPSPGCYVSLFSSSDPRLGITVVLFLLFISTVSFLYMVKALSRLWIDRKSRRLSKMMARTSEGK